MVKPLTKQFKKQLANNNKKIVLHFDFAFCNARPHLFYAKLWSCLYKYVIKLDYYNLHNFALLNLQLFKSTKLTKPAEDFKSATTFSTYKVFCVAVIRIAGIIGNLRADNGDRCPRKSRRKIDYAFFQAISRLSQVVPLQLYFNKGNLCRS